MTERTYPEVNTRKPASRLGHPAYGPTGRKPDHGLRRGDRYRPSDPRPEAWVSGRCADEVPQRGAERMRGDPGGRPPGQHS